MANHKPLLVSWALLALGVAAVCEVGCGIGTSSADGDLGKASFNASSCGGLLADLGGCDLKKQLAVGGLVDVRALANRDRAPLLLRSDEPSVLDVKDIGGAAYTLTGVSAGSAVLTAYSGSTAIDHLTIKVTDIAEIDYNTISNGFGTFKLESNGDIDGTYALGDTVTNFSLIFLQVDASMPPNTLLGRDSFIWELSTGLSFQPGKEMPHAMQFELARPATAGSYTLLVRAKQGGGRFKMRIDVK